MLFRGALLGSAGALAFLAAVAACAETKLAGPGAECFVATDCREGLVCIEQENRARICTDDPSRAAGRLPPEASVPDAGDEAGEAGEPPPDSAVDPPDTGAE